MKIYSKGAAIPAPSSKKEVQEDCLSCGESIVHPLCPCCVSKGFRQWVKNLPEKESKKILKRLNRFHKDHIYYDGKSKRCVSCNEFKTYLCPYCFTSFLHEVLKEAKTSRQRLVEFLYMFNFDFERKGYFRELESHGGY